MKEDKLLINILSIEGHKYFSNADDGYLSVISFDSPETLE
jgi:hypothetical protein